MAAQEVVDLFVGVRNPGVSQTGQPATAAIGAPSPRSAGAACYSRGGEYSDSRTKNGRVRPG